MNTCGMYDYAGEWQFTVGLPAKSGVGGGIIAVLPGHLGIGIFSPLLDPSGNSCRGVRVCRDLSHRFKLHLLSHRGSVRTVVRRRYRASEVRSKRLRRAVENEMLDRLGRNIVVYELQGDVSFGNLEKLTRAVIDDLADAEHFILDGSRLVWIDGVAYDVLARLAQSIRSRGKHLVLAGFPAMEDAESEPSWIAEIEATIAPDLDSALELCEDEVLAAAGLEKDSQRGVPLTQIDVLRDLSDGDLMELTPHLEARSFPEGALLVREGDPADRLFLSRGAAEIAVMLPDTDQRRRLATIEAGNVFGELAVFSGGTRTADVVALSELDTFVLTADALTALGTERPQLHIKLLTLVGRSLADRLRRANAEIRALSR